MARRTRRSGPLKSRFPSPARCLGRLLLTCLAIGLATSLHAPDLWAAGKLQGPLFFFEGVPADDAVDVARAAGLNAVVYRLPDDAPKHLDDIRDDLADMSKSGLRIILQLPTTFGREQTLDLSTPTYWQRLERYVAAVVPALRSTPGLAAWQTDDYLERAIRYSDTDFVTFLQDRYGPLDAVNASWGTDFVAWSEVTHKAALAANNKQPMGVGRSSVDVADWMADTFRAVMARWAALIRHFDPKTPLMTGRISLYRSLASVPTDYDIVVPAIRPGTFEDDPLAGDVHMVDMARRGGRFDVIPSLYMPLPPSQLFYQNALTWWALEAAAHGARGFCLGDWQRFSTYTPPETGAKPVPLSIQRVRDRLAIVARQVDSIAKPSVFNIVPRPSYAFLWTPYAGGLEAFKVPGYGYLPNWSPEEPSLLLWSFRRGCAYGTADVLTPADVPAVKLDQYGAIIAPEALSVSDPVASSLSDWVELGGALVADVGLGMYQSGDWKLMSPPLSNITGLTRFVGGLEETGNWQVDRGSSLLPDLPPGAKPLGFPGKELGVAPANQRLPKAFESWTTFCDPPPDVQTLAIAATRPKTKGKGRLISGIFGHHLGDGAGIYATFRLWGRWNPTDPLYADFFGPLCAFRAHYRLDSGFWPGEASLAATDKGAVVVAREAGLVRLTALDADDDLHTGAYCYTSAADRRPDGTRSGNVLLLLDCSTGGLFKLDRLPIAVHPYNAGCLSRVEAYSSDKLQILLYGDRANLREADKLLITRPKPSQVRIIVGDGLYHVDPGSSHLVTIQPKDRPTSRQVIEAGADGRLDLSLVAKQTTVTIQPAPTTTSG